MVKFRAKVDTYKNFRFIPKGTEIEEFPDFKSPNFERVSGDVKENVVTNTPAPVTAETVTDAPEDKTGGENDGGETETVTDAPEDKTGGESSQNFDDEDEVYLRNKAHDLGIPNWHLCGIPLLKQRIEEKLAQPKLPETNETGGENDGGETETGKNSSDNA